MRFTRVTLFFIAFIITLGFYQLARHFLADVEPQTFQATEEVMVDTANLLAELVERNIHEHEFKTEHLREAFTGAHQREIKAEIFDHFKSHVGLQMYLTDKNGIVLFDSDGGRKEGEDYSQKRDVKRTLDGKYGARSSRAEEDDSASSVLYVAAPIGDSAKPDGVLTIL
ncbi:MAG: hypothetical protein HC767_07980 [Akkermansiaceae bacterium]|nr:hypothetical protein [Akkermansiaceae bacterium]